MAWKDKEQKQSFTVTMEFEVNEGVQLADVALFTDKALVALQKEGNAASKLISKARVLSVEESTEIPDESED